MAITDRVISKAYVTPGHPVAFSTPNRVAKYFNVSRSHAKKLLESIEGYTLHREYKQPKRYNPYFVHNRREQIQADLIDISKIATQNNNKKFILLLIDIFTKRVWLYPLERKTANEIRRAFIEWLNNLDVKPKSILTDRGLEFTNQQIQNLLRQQNIKWMPAYGTLKAAIAERANKTIQILIYKYLTENETLQYLNVLNDLLQTYNTRKHRSLDGMTPMEADQVENEARVQAIFHDRFYKIGLHRKDNLPFKIGDLVRVKTQAKKSVSSSSRAYAEQFHGEYYRIVRINRTLPIALYYLKSLDTGDYIEGGFYAEELQRQRGNTYKIEQVLDERVRRGRQEIYVKWKYFGPQWNEWIPREAVQRAF